MRYQSDHKDEARSKLIEAAGRGFRRQGYGGIGVDGLAREAGLTSGAFYGHFKSKENAFSAAAEEGLVQLRQSIAGLQATHGATWLGAFIDSYLDNRLVCPLEESCGLQSLTSDVVRANEKTKAAYERELEAVTRQVAAGLDHLPAGDRESRAWALLALLSGGVTMARSMASDALRHSVARSLRQSARALMQSGP